MSLPGSAQCCPLPSRVPWAGAALLMQGSSFACLLVFKCMTGRGVASWFHSWGLSVLPQGLVGTTSLLLGFPNTACTRVKEDGRREPGVCFSCVGGRYSGMLQTEAARPRGEFSRKGKTVRNN